MNLKKVLSRVLLKTSILILLFSFACFGFSASQFFDLEVAENNQMEAGVLDMTLRSGQDNFVSGSVDVLAMEPGESVARDIYVGKTLESNPLRHQVSFQFIDGDADFCSQLNLRLWYDHYWCDPSGGYACRDMRLKYNGSLSSLSNFTDPLDFIIPHFDDLFDQNPSDGTEQWFFYQIFLPAGVNEIYQNKSCEFNFVYQGYQETSDGSWGFVDEEILGGNLIASGDWLGPTVTIESLSPNPTNVDPDLVARAQDGYSPIQTIYYDLYDSSSVLLVDDEPLTAQDGAYDSLDEFGQGVIDISGLADGIYTLYVFAQDNTGNTGQTPAYTLTIDRSLPLTTFYTSNSPLRQIKDDVLNGDFENLGNPLENWIVHGDAEVLPEDSFDGETVRANEILGSSLDNHMVKISPTDIPDGDLYYSSLSQEIPNSAKTLSFWYNFATYESVGFDNPGFSVYINEQEVFQIWAEDINYPAGEVAVSDWQKFYYDLDSFDMDEHPILTLVFYSGNRYDDAFDSWIYLDKISTNDVYVNDQTDLYLQVPAGLTSATTYYRLGPCLEEEFDPGDYLVYSEEFQLSTPTEEDKFCYFSRDEAENLEEPNEVTLIYDDVAPDPITDLGVTDLDDGEFMLDWTATDPRDPDGNDTAAYYLVKYSEDGVITEANFDDQADYQAESPRPDGGDDSLEVVGLSPGIEYHFAIKVCDAASNCSPISNVVSDSSGEVDPGVGGTGEVVINELMWMGSEISSADEWIELYNTTTEAINLKDWQIIKKRTDGIEQCMFTFPEYWLAPGDYVVVSEYDKDHSALNIACPGPKCLVVGEGYTNDRDFSLANSRLQIKLYNGYWVLPEIDLVDTADDGVGAPANGEYDSGEGIYHSMERDADPGNGADPDNWHSCDDPASVIYWDSGLEGEHFGTPGAANLSEMIEPSPSPMVESIPEPSLSPEPSPEPSFEPNPSPLPSSSPSSSPSLSPSPLLEPSSSPSPSSEPEENNE